MIKLLLTVALLFAAHNSLAGESLCEKKAAAVVESAERLTNPLIKKNERLVLSQRVSYTTTHLKTVVVQVTFNDRSKALYEVVLSDFDGQCSTISTLRRVVADK